VSALGLLTKFGMTEPAGGGPPPGDAYQYYRLHVLVAATGARVYLAEMELRATVGGPTITTGGTPSASSSLSGQPASLAFDADAFTNWISNTAQTPSTQQWLQYALPSAAGIAQYALQAAGITARVPTVFVLQGSNDGITWTPLDAREESEWGVREKRAYQPEFDGTGRYRYWRLRFTANNGDARVGTRQVQLREVVAGAQRAVYGIATASSEFSGTYAAGNAFSAGLDGNGWVSAGGVPQWLQYDFGVYPRKIAQYTVAIAGASSPANKAPKAWVLEASDNAVDWTEIDNVTGQTAWGTDEVRTFTV